MAPRFSLITAAYNVRNYLDEFIASVEGQTYPREDFEVIVVDDGSTDDTLVRLRRWEANSGGQVTILTKTNGGQASARNLGLGAARGDWISFPDPDDRLAPRYLSKMNAFLTEHPDVAMAGARRLLLRDATGELVDRHPLRSHFREGDVARDLDEQPDYFYSSAPIAFFRLQRIREMGLEFDEQIRPNFEDGHFAARYLLAAERPLVGFVRSAIYHYRKRADGSSTLGRSKADPRRYTTVLERGYLALILEAIEARGQVPQWLQSLVVYELAGLFSTQEALTGLSHAQSGDVARRHHELMQVITAHLDRELIWSQTGRSMRPVWRDVLAHGYRSQPWSARDGAIEVDGRGEVAKVTYHYTQEAPDELILSGGSPVDPLHSKVRDVVYHGRTLLHQRIIWLPATRSLRVRVAGHDLYLHPDRVPPRTRTLRRSELREMAGEEPGPHLTEEEARLMARARSRRARRTFSDAWVLMDRIHDADDSGEHLFAHLRRHRPDINAWFVIEKGTEDWSRLRRRHGRRVVAHGSDRWKILMLNARHLISSHADDPIVSPPALRRLKPPRWRFTFLQHGVIKDDLSVWLNRKHIDVMVTSTAAERASIVADHTQYQLTTKETVLTGLPRFDRLREIGLAHPEESRDLLLVAPTWRRWLTESPDPESQRHQGMDTIADSDFIRNWMGYLSSDALRAAADAAGLRIAFLPHPNLQPALADLGLPEHVAQLAYEGTDVRAYFARAALLVTDYSSVAFNAAYIERPSLYFQFDRDRMFGGEHVGGAGYFSYEDDGFGPVVTELREAISTTTEILRAGKKPAPEYLRRIEEAFGSRDGRCCERVVEAVEALDRPHHSTVAR